MINCCTWWQGFCVVMTLFGILFVLWTRMAHMGQSFGEFCTNAAMESKVSSIVWRDFMPNFSFHIRLCTVQQKSQNADKRFFDFCWPVLDWQPCLHEKNRVFECLVFDKLREKCTLKILYPIVYSNINLDWKMNS